MGSSGSGAADCGVGSIVWVRRRNGSWWPGKILGPEELSASHLMSPRSGTPVKLLGREDASVDWYNLEKSKRVKAFRCGEFDDCIERAESSQGMPIKKREKYARREDAILHALELENQLLKGQGLLGVTSARRSSKPSVSLEKEPVTSSGSFGNDNAKFGNLKSLQVSKKLDTSRKDEIIGSPLYLHKVKEESLFSREEDIPAATPRMRGLLDLGMRISPSKRMLSSSVSPNGSEKDALDNTSEARPTHGPSMTLIQGNGVNSLNKKKRPHEGLSEDILVKKRDRRRPLVQVLQNSAILEFSDSLLPDRGTVSTSIPGVEQMGAVNHAKRSRYLYLPTKSGDSRDYKEIPSSHIEMPSSRFGEGSRFPHLGSFIEESASGFMDDVPLDSSDTDSSESDSDDDSSETEPDMDLEMAALSESDPYALGRPEALDKYGSLSSDELEESAHSGDTFHHPTPVATTVPRWKSKGKRNVRNLPRKRMETLDGKAFDFSKRSSHHNTSFLHNDVTDDSEWNGRDAGGLMVGSGNGGYSMSPRYPFKSQNMSRWEDSSALEDQAVGGRYWEDPQEYFDSVYGHRGRSYLVEVDLQVQASYKKEPVPFVSLMSKLNGKAIIGHPIQIEKLDDGSTGTLLSTSNDFGNEAVFYDGNTALAPEWRTARRTVTRRPYTSSSGTFHGDEDFTFSDKERRPTSHKTSMLRKNVLRAPPPMDRKLQKKLPKSSMSSGQKRRALSSFDVENNKHGSKSGVEGLMKDEAGGPTTVACIPVKLVFSRLLEKINRPPSKGVSNVLLT